MAFTSVVTLILTIKLSRLYIYYLVLYDTLRTHSLSVPTWQNCDYILLYVSFCHKEASLSRSNDFWRTGILRLLLGSSLSDMVAQRSKTTVLRGGGVILWCSLGLSSTKALFAIERGPVISASCCIIVSCSLNLTRRLESVAFAALDISVVLPCMIAVLPQYWVNRNSRRKWCKSLFFMLLGGCRAPFSMVLGGAHIESFVEKKLWGDFQCCDEEALQNNGTTLGEKWDCRPAG